MVKMNRIFCCSFLALVGCNCPPISTPKPVNYEMVKSSVEVETQALEIASQKIDSVQKEAEGIEESIDSLNEVFGSSELPEETKTRSEEIFQSIVQSTTQIKNDSESIRREFLLVRAENEKILGMGEFLDHQAERIIYLENETERLRNEAIKAIYQYLVWVFILGFLVIIGGSVVAFFVGRKLGVSILAIGIVTLGFGAAATFYLKWIALTGFVLIGIGVVSTIGLLIYGVFEDRAKKKKLAQATVDNVKLIDAVKQELPEDIKSTFFGKENIPGIAHTIQTLDTQRIVANLRKKDFMDGSTLA